MAQASNYQRLRQRIGQAIQIAMDLRLHESDAHMSFGGPDGEWRRDMRRRTWWTTFSLLCHGSLVSGTVRMIHSPPLPPRSYLTHLSFYQQLPSIHPYDKRVTVEYPVCHIDSSVRALLSPCRAVLLLAAHARRRRLGPTSSAFSASSSVPLRSRSRSITRRRRCQTRSTSLELPTESHPSQTTSRFSIKRSWPSIGACSRC